jgi:hypothetical protein
LAQPKQIEVVEDASSFVEIINLSIVVMSAGDFLLFEQKNYNGKRAILVAQFVVFIFQETTT